MSLKLEQEKKRAGLSPSREDTRKEHKIPKNIVRLELRWKGWEMPEAPQREIEGEEKGITNK